MSAGEPFRRSALSMGLVLLAVVAASAEESTHPTKFEFPRFEAAVARYFQQQPNWREGDLVSRSDLTVVFALAKRAGWPDVPVAAIEARVLPDSHFLVQKLRTPAGIKFMRDVARYPQAYDLLEQLAALPHGRNTLERLIAGPDGYKLLQYMATTSGGQHLNQMLGEAPRGHDFGEPTGHLYTVDDVLTALKQARDKGETK